MDRDIGRAWKHYLSHMQRALMGSASVIKRCLLPATWTAPAMDTEQSQTSQLWAQCGLHPYVPFGEAETGRDPAPPEESRAGHSKAVAGLLGPF